jgi:hypothetical protein
MVRRTYAIVLIVVGIAAVGAGLSKVVPSAVAFLGGSLAFFGLVLTGLSFVPPPQTPPDAPPPLSPFERLAGIFYEPARVFQNLRAHPRWLLPLLIIALVSFAYTTAFTRRVTPERIAEFTTEKVVESGFVPADKADEIRQESIRAAKDPVRVWGGVVNTVVFTFCILAIIAGLYVLGILAFGGRINFWQALAVATHAALPVAVISRLLSLLLLYLKDPADLHPVLDANGLVRDNLSVLFSPAQHPVLYTVGAFFGVLSLYGLWLVATGLKNAGERVSPSAAWSVAIAIWVIGLILAVASAAAFGSFMS